MAIYKNDNGTWYVMIRYQDWTGARKQKCKRGFSTRKEAADWELQFKLQKKASVDMTMESFCTMYEEDVRPSLKQSTWLTKENIIQKKILPYLGKRKVSEITANGKSSYRGLGSIDFQAAARSVLIVGRIKDEPEVRVVCHTKSSLAPEGKAIAFRLDKNNGFEWIGEYDISADELLNGEGKGQKTRKAKEFLLEILADGGMAQKKIEEEAEKLGIKKKTLRNAKMELGIDSVKRGNQWYWMLSE